MSPVDPHKSLSLISFESIVKEPLPPIDWEVEPLVAKGDRVVVYGEFGAMKSWLLLDLALHLAAGRPWLGKFAIPQPRRVLYIDEEMNERTLRRRLKRLAMGANLEGEALPFRAMSRAGVRFRSLEADFLLKALEQSPFDPDVIIVEALRRVLVGSEIEAKDVSEFWHNVKPLLKAGKTFIISHHMRKPNALGNNAPRDRASGSTDILAGADAGYAVQRLGKDAVSVECVKSREAEETEPFVVSLWDESADGPVEMRYEGSHRDYQQMGTKVEKTMAQVEAFVKATPGHTATTSDILVHLKAQGIALKTGERALARMRKEGRVDQPSRGLYRLLLESNVA